MLPTYLTNIVSDLLSMFHSFDNNVIAFKPKGEGKKGGWGGAQGRGTCSASYRGYVPPKSWGNSSGPLSASDDSLHLVFTFISDFCGI